MIKIQLLRLHGIDGQSTLNNRLRPNWRSTNGACLSKHLLRASFLLLIPLYCSHITMAQDAAQGSWFVDSSGSETPVFLYSPTPTDFDPLTVSDSELAQYGFPPRPELSSVHYPAWKRMVTAKRIVPEAKSTNIYHASAGNSKSQSILEIASVSGTASSTSTNNWSGYAVAGSSGTFSANNSAVYGEWIVPAVQPSIGTCSGNWVYGAEFVGLDGISGSSDTLQAGTQEDAVCQYGGTQVEGFYAYVEWYPAAATQLNLGVYAGDTVQVEVWYTTAAPQGHAYILDVTTGGSITAAVSLPSGAHYLGNSAEWIMERPVVSGALADLPDYGAAPWNSTYAYNTLNYFYPSSVPSGSTVYAINMTCPPWNPSASCTSTTTISNAGNVLGLDALWFTVAGPAQ